MVVADQFAVLVKDLQEVAGLTQQAIADGVGARQSTIARWAKGENTPSGRHLVNLRSLHSRLVANSAEGQGAEIDQTIAARLHEAIGGEDAEVFARRSGTDLPSLNAFLAGAIPSVRELLSLADGLNVTLDWLATGRGDMRPGQRAEVVSADDATAGELVEVPFAMTSASAGPGLIPVNDGEGSIWVSESFLRRYGLYPRTTHAIIVDGDSMLRRDGSGIPPGCMAFLNTAIGDEDIITGCIYVLTRNSEVLLKRIERHLDGTMTLHSDNERYRPEHVSADVMLSLHVVGRLKVVMLEF